MIVWQCISYLFFQFHYEWTSHLDLYLPTNQEASVFMSLKLSVLANHTYFYDNDMNRPIGNLQVN